MDIREETRDFIIGLKSEAGGFMVSGRPKAASCRPGISDTLAERKLFRRHAAALAEFDHLRALALFWDAVLRFEPRGHLLKNVVRLEEKSLRVCRECNDQPVVSVPFDGGYLALVAK